MSNAKSVIDSTSIENHLIKKYNFKVLSSKANTSTKEDSSKDEDIIEEEELGNEIEESKCSAIKDTFIDELLQKSDKMSSDIVKLQMQIEEGQKEFEARLAKQTEEALKEGELKGYEKAKQEMKEEIENLRKQYLNSIEKMDNIIKEFNEHFEHLKEQMSEVSLEIAKEVIEKELSEDSKSIAYSLAKKLIDEIKDATKITIKTNPKDYEYVKEKFSSMQNVEVSKDEAISEGGVILLSEMGNIDGDIKTRVEKARELIMEKIK